MKIAYVNLFVGELDRAVEFYSQKLGLELQFSDSEHGYASLSAGPVTLGLALPGPDQEALLGRHTGIGLAVEDLVAEHKRLAALGVEFAMEPMKQPWGGFMALVADPDGNLLYLDEVAVMHPPAEGDD
jgi:predicted enzyme related to lactoylglutathione lyase